MSNIKYNNFIFVPEDVANKIESLNFRRDVKNRVCSFLKTLMVDSKRLNDDSDIFNYVPRSRNYLRKVLGGSYAKHLKGLLELGIIDTTGYKAGNTTENPECRYYKINNYNKYNNKEDNQLLVICDTLFDEVPKNIGFRVIEYNDYQYDNEYLVDIEYKLKSLTINEDKLYKEILDKVNSINIKNFLVNEDIVEDFFPLKISDKEVKYFKKEGAISYARSLGKDIIKDKRNFVLSDIETFIKDKKEQKLINDITNVLYLTNKVFRANRNTTNNRLDSNLTNISSYLLDVIKNDNDLVEIDLCNSQFAILTLIVDLATEDYKKFKELVLNCGMYEYLQDELSLTSRDLAKTICFEVMFSSHKNKSSRIKDFKNLFPSVMDWINTFKELNGYENFSITLQKKEAEIFIDNLYPRIVNNGIFVLTKHDSLIVKQSDEQKVRDIIENYFKEIDFNVAIR